MHRSPALRAHAISVLLVGVLAPVCAAAQQSPTVPEGPPPSTRRLSTTASAYVQGAFGFGVPAGLIGVGLGVMPVPWASVEVSGGLSDSGPQVAAMGGLHLQVKDTTSLGLASGVSVGRYSDVEPDYFDFNILGPLPEFEKYWDWVLWSNTEVQVRHALSDHTVLRLDLGVTVPVANATSECTLGDHAEPSDCEADTLPEQLAYVGGAVEYHF